MKITLDTSSHSFRTFFTISLLLFSFILLGSAAYSWTNPSGTPPNNNVAAPLNVSSVSQVKSGPVGVNGLHNIGATRLDGNVGIGVVTPGQKLDVSGYVRGTGFCIGESCKTSLSVQCVTRNNSASVSVNGAVVSNCLSDEFMVSGECNFVTRDQSGGTYYPSASTMGVGKYQGNGYRCVNDHTFNPSVLMASARCCK